MPAPVRRCPECGYDAVTVSPSDAAVAARSYPRRFRALLVRPGQDDPDIVHRRPSPGEASAAEHAMDASAGMAAATAALHRIASADDPVVQLELTLRPAGPDAPLEEVLARLQAAADALAIAIEGVHGDAWSRSGHRPDGEPVTALDAARAGVHAGTHHLRAAERTIAAVR